MEYVDEQLVEVIEQIDSLKNSIRNDLLYHDWDMLPQARAELKRSPKEKVRRFLIRYTQTINSDFGHFGLKSRYKEFFIVVVLVSLFTASILVTASGLMGKGWKEEIATKASILLGSFYYQTFS